MKAGFCVKQCFIFRNRGGKARIMEHFQERWEDYSTTEDHQLFNPPNHFSTSCFKDHPPQVILVPFVPRITPLDIFEEAPFTRCQQVLISRSGYLWPHYFHQVVHIRGHGFSKRFIPAEVYSSTRTNQLLAPPGRETEKYRQRGLIQGHSFVAPYPWDSPKQGHLSNRELATSWRHLFSLSEIWIRVRPSVNLGRP